MNRVDPLPPALGRLGNAGVALDFGMFDGATGAEDDVLDAIALVLDEPVNRERLRALGGRVIDERAFLGSWIDHASGDLLRLGEWRLRDGRVLTDPPLPAFDRNDIRSGGGPLPDPGRGGEFAYAFAHPPYSLTLPGHEVQRLFDGVRATLLPRGVAAVITDWSSPLLPEVSRYFVAGMEWWGVFLFSIHLPALERLTIVAGSSTD